MQRHRKCCAQFQPIAFFLFAGSTILDCLKDPDVSIRQRALELTYQLVDSNNVVELVREMLNYLVVSPPEHRNLLCNRVGPYVTTLACEFKLAPSRSLLLLTSQLQSKLLW